MSSSLAPLAGDPYYQNGTPRTESDKLLGKHIEIWLLPLAFGTRVPPIYTITEDTPGTVVQGSTELVASATDDQAAATTVNLYRGDILLFGDRATGVGVVVSADTTVATGTSIPIFAASATLGATSARTYACIPYYSAMEGGPFNITGSLAESLNRMEGLFPAKAVVRRDATTALSGAIVRDDMAAALLANAATTAERFWYQCRFNPFIEWPVDHFGTGTPYNFGAGPHAKESVVIVESADMPAPNEDFAQTNFTLSCDGMPMPYGPLESV